MFLRSQISILGMYHYDNTLFNDLKVPTEMDKDIVITEILSQCAELELVYPDLDTMKELIKSWNKSELHIWSRVYEDCTIKYNPIWNVDGEETETITRELSGQTSDSSSGKVSNQVDSNNEAINSTKGYNSNSWTEADKTSSTGKDVSSGSTSENRNGSNSENESITTTKTRGGNIGVTMTQQMLNADLDILPRLNPYQYIVDSFRKRFCLLVY